MHAHFWDSLPFEEMGSVERKCFDHEACMLQCWVNEGTAKKNGYCHWYYADLSMQTLQLYVLTPAILGDVWLRVC